MKVSPKIDDVRVNVDGQGQAREKENERLHQLARNGDFEQMQSDFKEFKSTKELVEKRLNAQDREHLTPLHYAARHNYFDVCLVLVENGADVKAIGEDEVTPLHLAAKYNRNLKTEHDEGKKNEDKREAEEDNVKVIRLLLANGAEINKGDKYNLTPLHYACMYGNKTAVHTLIGSPGVDIEVRDLQEMTPLHYSALYGQTDITDFLIKKGANMLGEDKSKSTPVHHAARRGNLEIVDLLLMRLKKNYGSGIESQMLQKEDKDGNTPLHFAVESGFDEISKYFVDKLKERGLLDVKRKTGEAPLHLAARNDKLYLVKLLAIKGANMDAQNEDKETPLMLASKQNNHKVVEYLLKSGARMEIKNSDDCTALLIAAGRGHSETVQLLIENGVDVKAVDWQERNVLHQCLEENTKDVLRMMLHDGDDVYDLLMEKDKSGNIPLHHATAKGSFAVVKVLLEFHNTYKISTSEKNEEEQTAFLLAARNGQLNSLKKYPDRTAMLNDFDEKGYTALHHAAEEGKEKCVEFLLKKGANSSARNVYEQTPLHLSAKNGHRQCAEMLLKYDSDCDLQDKANFTPLHHACENGHVELVKLLLEWNANVCLPDETHQSALERAVERDQEDCAMAIVESDHWEKALKFTNNEDLRTPIRCLIRRMPSVARVVFGKCCEERKETVFESGKKKEVSKFTFNFEYIDDIKPTEYRGNLSKGGKGSYRWMNDHCLKIMATSNQQQLLSHPLVLALLFRKWHSGHGVMYIFSFLLYSLLLAVFNAYMITLPSPLAVNETETIGSCVVFVKSAQRIESCESWWPSGNKTIFGLIIIHFMKEVFQMLCGPRLYLAHYIHNGIEIILLVLMLTVVINPTEYGGIGEAWQWQVGAIAVFLSWIVLLLHLEDVPFGDVGLHISMFRTIFTKFFWIFISFYLLLIFGFASSFYIIFQNQDSFNSWNSLMKTLVMMIGELDYGDTFSDQLFYPEASYILFVLFIFMMMIIAMNLLVGLAVDDIRQLEAEADLNRLSLQVDYLLQLEYTAIFVEWLPPGSKSPKYEFKPSNYSRIKFILYNILHPTMRQEDKIKLSLHPPKDETEVRNAKVESRIHRLDGKIEDMDSRSVKMEEMMKKLLKHMKVSKIDDDDE